MDRTVIDEKIESLRRCVQRVRDRSPASADDLSRDPDAQDIITLNLTRAVQLAVDIASHCLAEADLPAPNTMGESFERLAEAGIIGPDLARRLRKAVGFRNIAVHSYSRIDWAIVHALCVEHIGDFAEFVRDIVAAR